MSDTVKIKCPENTRAGYAVINDFDFDPEVHELFDAPTPAEAPEKPAGGGDGIPVAIPGDWETMHHNKQISLAKELSGDVVPSEGQTATEKARAIILEAVTDRANPPVA